MPTTLARRRGEAKARGGRTGAPATSIHPMTRFLLTWLAFATLPLGAPRSGSGAELRPGGESTRPVRQIEAASKDVLARLESRSDDLRPTHAPPLASTGATWLDTQPALGGLPARQPVRSGPLSRIGLLPEARAPPA